MFEAHGDYHFGNVLILFLVAGIPHELVAFVLLCKYLYAFKKVGHDLFITPVADGTVGCIKECAAKNRDLFDYNKAGASYFSVFIS